MITTWSHPTWNFLHTFVYNLDETFFLNNKSDIFHIIRSIMGILPCPTCRKDATSEIKKLKENNIRNKNDLIMSLFHFHNYVNVKTKKRAFHETILKRYENMNIKLISNNFFSVMYNYKQVGIHMYDSFYRKKVIKNISQYIQKNINQIFTNL